ncbi:MAG: AraC family transcriptional regulator [Chitinophagales bacterium]
MTFRARFIAHIIQFAAKQGADQRILLDLVGRGMYELNNDELMFEAGIYNAVIEKALQLTADACLGLHLGEYLSLSAAGLIVQIVQSSRTVEEALKYMVEFANLGCQAMPFQLKEKQDEWELSLHPNPIWAAQSPQAVRHTMDGTVAFTLREFHTLTRQQYYPNRIHFAYSRPSQMEEYERLFKCPIYFNQPFTAFYLDKKHIAEPVITSDYYLLQILVQYAEQKLMSLQTEGKFSTIVRQSIVNLLKPQFPTIEQVASNLNISVRTLQRRLKEEDLTYKNVLDNLKRQFAVEYLKNKALSVKEVAYLLDYADASSFIRSFKRWTEKSPEAYRQVL